MLDLARKHQLPSGLVTQINAVEATFIVSKARDVEGIAMSTCDLDPIGITARAVLTVLELGNHSLQLERTGVLKDRFANGFQMLAVLQRPLFREVLQQESEDL